MLEQLHARDNLEAARLFRRQRLRSVEPIVDLDAGFELMQSRHRERLVGEIDAEYLGAGGRHRFGENASPTADVEGVLPLEAPAAARDIVQTQWIDVVQRLEVAGWIPPAMRQRAELRELGRVGVEGRVHCMRACHTLSRAASSVASSATSAAPLTIRFPAIHTSVT